jgi:predicted DNA-binding protein
MSERSETVNVKLPVVMRDQMMSLAKSNERTFAAEVRIAIREHLARRRTTTRGDTK